MNTPKLNYIVNTPCTESPYNNQKGKRSPLSDNIECNDGAKISVQCSHGHYCVPTNDIGPWTHVECFTESIVPDSWAEYICDELDNGYIYNRIPVSLIREFILSHGGEK